MPKLRLVKPPASILQPFCDLQPDVVKSLTLFYALGNSLRKQQGILKEAHDPLLCERQLEENDTINMDYKNMIATVHVELWYSAQEGVEVIGIER